MHKTFVPLGLSTKPHELMGRSPKQLKNYTADQVKSLIDSKTDYKIGIKLFAVYQVAQGRPSREIGALFHASFRQILAWADRLDEEGVEGLKTREGQGRKPKLNNEQLQELKNVLLQKTPEDYGYNSGIWTGPLLRDFIRERYGVSYGKTNIYNVLKKLGFSYQKGRGIYPEASTKQQEEFKESLKKTS
jgi:transposase